MYHVNVDCHVLPFYNVAVQIFLASAAKRKVKETLTGKKQEPDKTGGMGGLFPSSGEKDKKPKEKSGLFGGLLKAEAPGDNSGGEAFGAGGSNAADNSGADSSE